MYSLVVGSAGNLHPVQWLPEQWWWWYSHDSRRSVYASLTLPLFTHPRSWSAHQSRIHFINNLVIFILLWRACFSGQVFRNWYAHIASTSSFKVSIHWIHFLCPLHRHSTALILKLMKSSLMCLPPPLPTLGSLVQIHISPNWKCDSNVCHIEWILFIASSYPGQKTMSVLRSQVKTNCSVGK